MKPTVNNFYKLCQMMYNFTGLSYWNRLQSEYSYDLQNGVTWFELFYSTRTKVMNCIKKGMIYKYPYIRINGCIVSFIGNDVKL